ncbi:tubulin tyrosine ligase-like 5 isoform 1-T3 [Glossina fuscipes fuscipes]
MSTEDDRLQKSEFAELIQHLTQQEILTVEYCVGAVWQKLVTQKDAVKRLFQCNLCKVLQYSMKNLCAHLDGKRHKQQLKSVLHLYHPDYTHPKSKLLPPIQTKSNTAKETSSVGVAPPSTAESKAKKSLTISTTQVNTSRCVVNAKIANPTSTDAASAAKQAVTQPTAANGAIMQVKAEVSTANNFTKTKNIANVSNQVTITSQNSEKNAADLRSHITKAAQHLTASGGKAKLEKCANLVVRVQNLGKVENPNETAKKIQNSKQKNSQAAKLPNGSFGSLKNIGLTKVIVKKEKVDDDDEATDKNAWNKEIKKPASKSLETATVKNPIIQKNNSVVAGKSSPNAASRNAAASKANNNNNVKLSKAQYAGQTKNKQQDTSSSKPGIQNEVQTILDTSNGNTTIQEQQQKSGSIQQASFKTYKISLTPKSTNGTVDGNSQQSQPPKLGKTSQKVPEMASIIMSKMPIANENLLKYDKINNSFGSNAAKLKSNKNKEESETQDIVEYEMQDETGQTSKVLASARQIERQVSPVKGKISVKSMASLVKNPFALKGQENQKEGDDQTNVHVNDNSLDSPLIIIDDEDIAPITVTSEKSAKNDDICEKSAENGSNNVDGVNIVDETSSIIIDDEDSAAIYPIVPGTRKVNSNKEDKTKNSAVKRSRSSDKISVETSKRQKLVLNPASAFTEKETECENNNKKTDKPRYETDKVIIPTKHKSSLQTQSSSSSSLPCSQNQPNFTNKTFSFKDDEDEILGLLGVEYVIKIIKSRDDHSPRYECGLCELILDGFAMQRHLQAYNHRLKFCEKHFPTAIRHYKQYMGDVPQHEIFKVMTPVLGKLAVAIEKHHGRNLPYESFERDFNVNRHEILAKAFSCRHASEHYGPSFTHLLDSKEIDQIIADRHFFKPMTVSNSILFDKKTCSADVRHGNRESQSMRDRHRHVQRSTSALGPRQHDPKGFGYQPQNSSSLSSLMSVNRLYSAAIEREPLTPVDNETHRLMVEDFLKGTLKNAPDKHLPKRPLNRKRSPSPPHSYSSGYILPTKRLTISPPRRVDIWREYRHLVDKKLSDLNNSFKAYKEDPERHPSYNAEWQKFWKRRKDELIAAGLDHRKYNYQPEWVRFFKIRIEELYSEEAENIKIKLRENLSLPMSNDYLIDPLYHVQAVKENSPTRTAISPQANRQQSERPVILDSSYQDSSPQVVSVLRLMTALEEHLGSLGPKITQLLSKALQMEKINPRNVNSVMLTDENWSLIETAKEKFKGLVMAGLYEGSKERALNKAIQEAERLFNYAEEVRPRTNIGNCIQTFPKGNTVSSGYVSPGGFNTMQSSNNSRAINSSKQAFVQSSSNAMSVEATLPVNVSNEQTLPTTLTPLLTQADKKELASKLASSLVAQGKTDFDVQQLQKLIAVYSLIEKKKREAGTTTGKKKSNNPSNNNCKTLSETLADLLKNTSPSNEETLGREEIIRNQVADKSKQQAPMQAVNKESDARSNASQFLGNVNTNMNYQNISMNPSATTTAFPNSFSGGNYFTNTTPMMRSNMNANAVNSGAPPGGYNNANMMIGYHQNNQQYAAVANSGQYNNRQYPSGNNQFSSGIWNVGFQENQYNRGGGNWSRY